MVKHGGFGIGVVAIVMAFPSSLCAQSDAEARAGARAGGDTALQRAAPELAPGAAIHAVLETRLDARSAKVGDAVRARISRAVLSGETIVLPRGSKLLGTIRSVQTGADASARSESRLGVSFDRAVLPDGDELAVDLAIQGLSVAEAQLEPWPHVRASRAFDPTQLDAPPRSLRGGLLGENESVVLGAAAGLDAGLAADVELDDGPFDRPFGIDGEVAGSSAGVIGLRGLQLDSTGKASVIVRASGPVIVSSGVWMLLRAKGGGQ